jgi:predicted  nucleic acid-binding Zn-ribbon protein
MAEEETKEEEVDLSGKLEKLVEEIKEVMERRRERIAELRSEIESIEQDNVKLENTIGELLKGF